MGPLGALDLPGVALTGFLLGAVRAAAWLFLAPPFNTRMLPAKVKAMVAVGLTLPVSGLLAEQVPRLDAAGFAGAVLLQVLTGAALGFLTQLFFAAVQAAGDLIDLFGGFTLAYGYDPLSMSHGSVFGRLHQLLAVTLLFTSGAHLMVVRGFLESYRAIPVSAAVDLPQLGAALTSGLGVFFLAALQIAAPVIGVLVVADVGLGLLTRVSPSLNALSMGFPVKILLTLVVVGATFPLLPGVVGALVEQGVRAVQAMRAAGG